MNNYTVYTLYMSCIYIGVSVFLRLDLPSPLPKTVHFLSPSAPGVAEAVDCPVASESLPPEATEP